MALCCTATRWGSCGSRPPHPHDRQPQNLIGELSTRSDAFRTLWGAHDAHVYTDGAKPFHHPVVGEMELVHESRSLPGDDGLSLTVHNAEPGTPIPSADVALDESILKEITLKVESKTVEGVHVEHAPSESSPSRAPVVSVSRRPAGELGMGKLPPLPPYDRGTPVPYAHAIALSHGLGIRNTPVTLLSNTWT
ncbi:hypothetical protein DF19_11085 [Streptomyces olindensis]|nr:hypothetical protein DF19_11085 [Streptomyces olindensis]